MADFNSGKRLAFLRFNIDNDLNFLSAHHLRFQVQKGNNKTPRSTAGLDSAFQKDTQLVGFDIPLEVQEK